MKWDELTEGSHECKWLKTKELASVFLSQPGHLVALRSWENWSLSLRLSSFNCKRGLILTWDFVWVSNKIVHKKCLIHLD